MTLKDFQNIEGLFFVFYLTKTSTSLLKEAHLKRYNIKLKNMKNYNLKTVALIFGVVLFATNISFGQSQDRQERKAPPTFKQLIKEMDANEDGKLAKDELKGPLKKDFAKIDTNEDGFISEKEFKNAPKPERRKRN